MAIKKLSSGFGLGTPIPANYTSSTFIPFSDPSTNQPIYLENEQGEFLSQGERPILFKTQEEAEAFKTFFDKVYFISLFSNGNVCEIKSI